MHLTAIGYHDNRQTEHSPWRLQAFKQIFESRILNTYENVIWVNVQAKLFPTMFSIAVSKIQGNILVRITWNLVWLVQSHNWDLNVQI